MADVGPELKILGCGPLPILIYIPPNYTPDVDPLIDGLPELPMLSMYEIFFSAVEAFFVDTLNIFYLGIILYYM